VLPIVLYNGEARWDGACELTDLIEPVPGGLGAYRPQLRYLLLDQGAIVNDPAYSPALRNLAAALFQLEHARDEATWLGVYRRLVEVLDSEELGSLKLDGRGLQPCRDGGVDRARRRRGWHN
jgi:hypothetical protein